MTAGLLLPKSGADSADVSNRPSFSVITVTFNALGPLKATVASVQAQQYGNIEHIVVDGGSFDGTVEFLRGPKKHTTQWISEPDKGIYDAMNKGLQLARGEYVHFLNAGDTFTDDDTLRAVAALLAERPTLLMNRVRAIDGSGVRLFPKAIGLTQVREVFFSAYCHQAAFVRRDAYLAVGGFDLAYRHFADFKALWSIRSLADCLMLETAREVADFPLDGVSSDWRQATELTQERERLLAELGDSSKAWQYNLYILRARLYTFRMLLRHRLRLC